MRWIPLALAAACGDPEPVDPCASTTPPLTCGAWVDDGFAPLSPGDPLEMSRGPAGGWYLRLGAALRGEGDTAVLRTSVTIPDAADLEISATPQGNAVLLEGDACEGRSPELLAFLDTSAIDPNEDPLSRICGLAGDTLRVHIEGERGDGPTARCEVDGIATLDPLDVEPCAQLGE